MKILILLREDIQDKVNENFPNVDIEELNVFKRLKMKIQYK